MKSTITIFVPAYEAAATLGDVIERIPAETWARVNRVFVINDGSSDGTAALASELAGRYQAIEVVSFARNRGYGAAVAEGLARSVASGADFVACLHADGQYPPEEVAAFADHMHATGLDLLQGSRHLGGTALAGGMPVYKFVAGKCLVWLENRVFGLRMTDYHSGFIVYRRTALERLPFDSLGHSFDFDLEMIALARARSMRVGELAIPTRYAGERSHLNPVTYGLRVLRVLARFALGRYAPARTDPA